MDLDRFTTDQLTRMADQAADAAVAHYARAARMTEASKFIPFTDRERFELYQDIWRASMAAGNEQEELCRAIGDEIRMRSVCDA